MRKITEAELKGAVSAAGLPEDVFERIRGALAAKGEEHAGFEAAHISYYLGSLLIIGAMGWFVTSAWDTLSGAMIFAIALVYATVFGTVGVQLAKKPSTWIPGGLLTAVAVCMTPMAVYGLEKQMGWWPGADPGGYTNFHPMINGSWVGMEAVTILVAALALRLVRFPFITAPAAYALWYMSMDATSLLFGKFWTFKQECWISVGFGVVMLLVAYIADGESKNDFAFWFYLFGLLAFSGGLTCLGDGSQVGKVIYGLIHLGLIVLSIVLQRRVFLVVGGIGLFCVLGSEAMGYFKDSFGFTVALTVLGIGFIGAGLLYKRHEAALTEALSPWIPERVRHRHAG